MCMRKRPSNVELCQAAVEINRGRVLLYQCIDWLVEAAGPGLFGGGVVLHCCRVTVVTRFRWQAGMSCAPPQAVALGRKSPFGQIFAVAKSINQNVHRDALPDFRNLGVILRVVLIVLALSGVLALAQACNL